VDVQLDHPVFFDHRMDHLPGMLLIAAALDAVREPKEQGDGESGRLVADFVFTRYCEIGADVDLEAHREAPAGEWTLQGSQNHQVVYTASIAHRDIGDMTGDRALDGTAGREIRPGSAPAPEPADGALVHRARRENILLGRPVRDGTLLRTALLPLPPGHYFIGRSPDARSVEELVEAARQLATLLWHDEYGAASDQHLILDRVEVDVSRGLPRTTPLELRWARRPRRGNRARFAAEIWEAGSTRHYAGFVAVTCRAVSATAYRRLRGGGAAR
jgi:hypothetical protein